MLSIWGLFIFSAVLSQAIHAQELRKRDGSWWTLAGEDLQNFKNGILAEHNQLREKHQAAPLRIEAELCKGAQAEAERYLRDYRATGNFSINPLEVDDRNYNDNTLGYHSFAKKKWTPRRVVEEWIKQGPHHNWNDNFFNPATGHFTQMIWGSTEEIGVGIAPGRTDRGEYVIVFVVRYSPPGNIMDRDTFIENVLPEKV